MVSRAAATIERAQNRQPLINIHFVNRKSAASIAAEDDTFSIGRPTWIGIVCSVAREAYEARAI
jgi:hypothetical protein